MSKMRNLFTVVLLLVASSVVAQGYNISCKVDSVYEGRTVYLLDKNSGESIDSCIVVGGKFVFNGALSGDVVYDVVVNRIKGAAKTLLLASGVDINVDFTARPIVATDNGGYNDALLSMNDAVKARGKEIDAQRKQLREEGKSDEEIAEILKPQQESVYGIYRKVIDENKGNILGAYVFNMAWRSLCPSLEQFDSIANEVVYAKVLSPLKNARIMLYQAKVTKPGCVFVDFTGFAGGETVRLSDYVGKGKYVLVDFWASWCGPCKKEMPGIIAVNSKYAGDRFMVVGVNISDNENNFKAAVSSYGIDYPQIFVPKKHKDNASLLYNVETIPYVVLFAPDGTILERFTPDEKLDEIIGSYLK